MSKRVCASSGGGIVVVVGVQGNEEVFYSRGNAGKRIDVCIASTLRDWGSYRWLVVEFHVNGQFVHFLVCGPPNLALTRRYHRFFTGAIADVAAKEATGWRKPLRPNLLIGEGPRAERLSYIKALISASKQTIRKSVEDE